MQPPQRRMPEVDFAGDFRDVMAKARQISAGTFAVPEGAAPPGRSVAIVTPGRMVMPVACPPAGAVSQEMIHGIRQLVPEKPKQDIVVIAFNDVVMQNAFSAQQANALIPFLGYLMGLAFDGHGVVVFEGHPSALASGCEGATLVFVDDAMIPHLQADWAAVVLKAMRLPQILVFGRDGSLKRIDGTGARA